MQMKGLAVLIFTLCALGCYGMSLAPITWVLIPEIFPNRIRGAAISVAVSALWIACFILTFMFPILRRGHRHGQDLLALLGHLSGRIRHSSTSRVPETKGKTLEQIERELIA